MNSHQGGFAIISDIHGNLEALNAVLQAIDEAGINRIICLGDIVGYGADFETCIDIVNDRCDVILRGNHDEAVIQGPVDFNPIARDVILYTRKAMKPQLLSSSKKRFRWNFLKGLEKTYQEGRYAFYHGSPRDPVKEYIMRTDIVFAHDKLLDIFRQVNGVCFIGHTHQPGVIADRLETDSHKAEYEFFEPAKMEYKYHIGNRKIIVNVGSVGQPRDSDNRASFVIIEDDTIHFNRVVYDFRTAMSKIEDNPDIHDNCAARLALGK